MRRDRELKVGKMSKTISAAIVFHERFLVPFHRYSGIKATPKEVATVGTFDYHRG